MLVDDRLDPYPFSVKRFESGSNVGDLLIQFATVRQFGQPLRSISGPS